MKLKLKVGRLSLDLRISKALLFALLQSYRNEQSIQQIVLVYESLVSHPESLRLVC